MVIVAAYTAARIGDVSGCRAGDIDATQWIWTVRRRTTAAPGGLTDKGTKGKRARQVPIVEEIRPLVAQHLLSTGPKPDARLSVGLRGGRISTAVLRDATHWDDAVTKLGHEHLRRAPSGTPDRPGLPMPEPKCMSYAGSPATGR
ncbi:MULTISPECIES: hypothetical protein [unclassified Streptomyces]|uniref:hypothetical protein n=1 Tax=unclassified Streptomyces TaxID=2593676 RepID=UPI00382920CA